MAKGSSCLGEISALSCLIVNTVFLVFFGVSPCALGNIDGHNSHLIDQTINLVAALIPSVQFESHAVIQI